MSVDDSRILGAHPFALCLAAEESDPMARARQLSVEVVRLWQEGRYAEGLPKAREASVGTDLRQRQYAFQFALHHWMLRCTRQAGLRKVPRHLDRIDGASRHWRFSGPSCTRVSFLLRLLGPNAQPGGDPALGSAGAESEDPTTVAIDVRARRPQGYEA